MTGRISYRHVVVTTCWQVRVRGVTFRSSYSSDDLDCSIRRALRSLTKHTISGGASSGGSGGGGGGGGGSGGGGGGGGSGGGRARRSV
jgi:hypothetical protein